MYKDIKKKPRKKRMLLCKVYTEDFKSEESSCVSIRKKGHSRLYVHAGMALWDMKTHYSES